LLIYYSYSNFSVFSILGRKRLMIKCPKCQSEACVKDGIVQGRQRHGCKDCGYRHTVKERGLGADKKRQALALYLEGLEFRSIGRCLQCRHVAIYNGIKSHGAAIEGIRAGAGVRGVEMDEMPTYVGSKKRLLDPDGCGSLWKTLPPRRGGFLRHPNRRTVMGSQPRPQDHPRNERLLASL
jgi:transposase